MRMGRSILGVAAALAGLVATSVASSAAGQAPLTGYWVDPPSCIAVARDEGTCKRFSELTVSHRQRDRYTVVFENSENCQIVGEGSLRGARLIVDGSLTWDSTTTLTVIFGRSEIEARPAASSPEWCHARFDRRGNR